MSTRATYHFGPDNNERFHPKATVYIHHDGYEAGAASYFYNMLANESKGCAATQFIRANDGAELTTSHQGHGDTEYRYDLRGHGPNATLVASKRYGGWGDNDVERWLPVFSGPLRQFIERHPDFIEGFTPFQEVQLRYSRTIWLNGETAEKYMNREYSALNHLRVWSKNGTMTRNAANWKGCAEDLAALVVAFPELMTDEIAELLKPEPTEV